MELKPLSVGAIRSALDKAEHYRLLNEPAESESICLDVLALDPANERALTTMLLAQTDLFHSHDMGAWQRARDTVAKLASEYDRAYYSGIIAERRAKARLAQAGFGAASAAREWLNEARKHFADAEPLRSAGNDDAILRWNACTRLLARLPAETPDEPSPPVTSE
jgi:hypothetical protein